MLNWLKRTARANVAVEFALITALFTLPLLLGAADFVSIIAAKAQLNTALQALYYYAVTSPGTAATASGNEASIIATINANSDFQITAPSTAASPMTEFLTYSCYSTAASPLSFTPPSTTDSCTSSQVTMTFANYTLTTKLTLPVPLPGLSNPLTLSASGSIQIN